MSHLDEPTFAQAIAACAGCGGTAFEIASYIDRQQSIMLGDPNDDGRWVHDGEKFIDGVYRIRCVGCGAEPYASDDCPRCHRASAVRAALAAGSRLAAPKRCPSCTSSELTITGFAPATARTGGKVVPAPIALYGEPGFHVAVVMCDGCEWVAAAEGCPICGAPEPLRARPG